LLSYDYVPHLTYHTGTVLTTLHHAMNTILLHVYYVVDNEANRVRWKSAKIKRNIPVPVIPKYSFLT